MMDIFALVMLSIAAVCLVCACAMAPFFAKRVLAAKIGVAGMIAMWFGVFFAIEVNVHLNRIEHALQTYTQLQVGPRHFANVREGYVTVLAPGCTLKVTGLELINHQPYLRLKSSYTELVPASNPC